MPPMRPFRALVRKEHAMETLLAAIVPLDETEPVPTGLAHGRVLAGDVVAPVDVPAFTRSVMDGYAVVARDTAGASPTVPVALRLVETVHAGDLARAAVTPGACMQIATGGKLPEGADVVVRVEDTALAPDGRVLVREPVTAGANLSRRGSDIQQGARVLASGALLSPARIGVLASLGVTSVRCRRRPRVALVPTGNEVVELGEPLRDGQVYNSNSLGLAALVESHGGFPLRYPVVPDAVAAHREALDRAEREADLIVVSGGSSVGEKDLLAEMVRERGEVLVHGIEIKPGKPLLVGRLRSGKVLIGLPGNPTSCLMNAYLFLVPALRKLARLPPHRPVEVQAIMGARVAPSRGRFQYVPVRLDGDTAFSVFKESGALTSMADADGFIGVEKDTAVEPGEGVRVTLF